MAYLFIMIVLNFGFAGFFDSDKKVYQTFDVIDGDFVSENNFHMNHNFGNPQF